MRRRQPEQAHVALARYLKKAGEVGIRSYVDMIVGSLQARAASTRSTIDDVIVVCLLVLVDRLFPADADPDPAVQDDVT